MLHLAPPATQNATKLQLDFVVWRYYFKESERMMETELTGDTKLCDANEYRRVVARLARLEAIAEGMANVLKVNKAVSIDTEDPSFFTSTDASALDAYEAYMAEQKEGSDVGK